MYRTIIQRDDEGSNNLERNNEASQKQEKWRRQSPKGNKTYNSN